MFLGIDMGTSGIRLIVIDSSNRIKARITGFYTQIDKAYNHHSTIQNPTIWWQLLLVLIKQLSKEFNLQKILCLSIDGTSGTIIATDDAGKPIHPALMYNNAQAIIEAEQIGNIAPNDFPFSIAESGLSKILYLKHHITSHKTQCFFNQSDWLYFQLTQQLFISDENNALKMGYDALNKQWPAWFTLLNLDTSVLPKVYLPGQRLNCDTSILPSLGFSEQIQLASGTTDSTAAIYACGANKPGDAITSLGSTLVTKIVCATPINHPKFGVYSQPYGQYWLVGGASNSGGNVLQHYFTDQEIQDFTMQINPKQLVNLFYYPLVSSGERFPEYDINKTSILKPRPTNQVKFFQAILEGIADIEAKAYALLEQLGAPKVNHVVSMGRGSKNLAWQQIRQEKLGVDCSAAIQTDSAYGTALLAKSAFIDHH